MAMNLGGGNRRKAEINVTPMIDILLVLIIVFMIVLPSNSLGLNTRIPQKPDDQSSSSQSNDNAVVITVEGNKKVRLNQEPLALEDLGRRLQSLFAGSSGQVIFVRADKGLNFEEVAQVIDIARGAGLMRIALTTE